MSLQDIYNIRKEMKKLHRKYEILNKKQSSFGLTAEEEISLRKLKNELGILREEMIESHLNMSVFPYLLNKEANSAIKEIQDIVPWHGGFILRNDDLQALYNAEKKLTQDQKELIRTKLEYVHKLILQQFEQFCDSDEGWEHMNNVSKILTNDNDGDILEVVIYLDMRYRDFAELLGIELEEVEVYFDGGEDDAETID